MLVMKNMVAKTAVVLVKKLLVPLALKKLLAPEPPPKPSKAPPPERCINMKQTKKIAVSKCNTSNTVSIFYFPYFSKRLNFWRY